MAEDINGLSEESGAARLLTKEVEQYLDRILRADGELIELPGRRSLLGEPLFISARFGEDVVPGTGYRYLNIDTFALRDGEYVPVGIKDYEIKGDVAYSNKQRHGHLPPVNVAQEAANRYWATGEALHVREDDLLKFAMENGGFPKMGELREKGFVATEEDWTKKIYQRKGIGSLMVASSILILKERGVESILFGSFTDSAEATWRKFGGREGAKMFVSELADSPNITTSIEPFVKQ